MIKPLLLLLLFTALLSCQNQIKFESTKWKTKEYPEAPPQNRKKMFKDLITNYKLIGVSKNDLVNLLGEPDYPTDSIMLYLIDEDYGTDIDPIYTKYLSFQLNSDSVVKDFKIEEWKK
ncbi:MAG: hypothetical protein HYX40_03390 [Sphingobacteriales bacterium]|nr:hypothetical protein [Sphingobacteriales bacterium]